ncbi:Fic-DOC domain mobile mystery protein B [Winogradskyella eximia]|jgi:Fic-DOC domain mobile mystery protein B|uniref:Fic-DOC domain mobile mystery protein B n=1 Tax=Winogradskyella eximia TaxID=262006 RepID=A0A3D9HAQ7_9FLAO|nr:mobile mystery protein B [Winogradskyella eximia]RED46567.1 Fic-DOC domain mobile mystery protein B [Winogradskyella eximia]
MGLDKMKLIKGQTALSEEEMEGLLIPTITTREELDEFEQLNIQKAVEWYLINRKFKTDKILTEAFIIGVHKKMLSDVWSWAGKYRTSEKTIGITWYQIPIKLRQLLDDCKFWIDNKTYSDEEIAIRFKHELVAIHLFPNGNGRHSRLMGDVVMKHIFNKPKFTWGYKNLVNKSEIRETYINALKKGDDKNFKDLISFAQS